MGDVTGGVVQADQGGGRLVQLGHQRSVQRPLRTGLSHNMMTDKQEK